MGMPTYSEKLRDPRWQKKRLEILERDGFSCVECGSQTKTLHVHHGYYGRGKSPWEYSKQSLDSLCKGCHERRQASLEELHEFFSGMSTFWLGLWAEVVAKVMTGSGIMASYSRLFGPDQLRRREHAATAVAEEAAEE